MYRIFAVAVVFFLILGVVFPSESITNELIAISKELEIAGDLLRQGLDKVEQSLTNSALISQKAEEALLRAESFLAKAEEKSKAASQALTISERALESLTQQTIDLETLFEDFKKQRQREIRRDRLTKLALILIILAETALLAIK